MKTKFIAEICSNHNGKLSRCLKFVDEAKLLFRGPAGIRHVDFIAYKEE